MEWCHDGYVVATRRHGETGVICDVFTREAGRWSGLVRGGRSRRLRPVLQPGNRVTATWRARLEDHLGSLTVEPLSLGAAAIIDDPFKLAGLTTMCAHLQLLAERDPHEALYDGFALLLDRLDDDAIWPALAVRWELGLLDDLGFGLDLGSCAATGAREDLVFVSPKSARAVSRSAGEPYRAKLLPLPAFLAGASSADGITAQDLIDGFALTGYFLRRHLYEPRGLIAPDQRQRIVDRLKSGVV